MQLVIPQDKLSQALKKVLNAISSRTTLPILNNVLLEAAEGKLTITGTDLELSIRTEAPALVGESGTTTVQAKKFAQIVAALPAGEVTLVSDANNQLTISCKKAKFKLVGKDDAEFPRETPPENSWSFVTTCGELRKVVEKVAYAATPDENRRVLNGILLSLRGGQQTLAATDGRRLAMVERPLPEGVEGEGDVILPPKAVSEIGKLGADDAKLTVQLSDRRVAFVTADTIVTSKLVEGTYPNYRQAIPVSFSQNLTIPREEFLDILGRVSMVLSETSSSVKLKLEKALMNVSASSSEIGESDEPLEVSYEGKPVIVAFNPQFLIEPLKHLESEHVTIDFNDEFSPVRISGDEGFLCVIMPMRV
ncbi:MAG: DNA polymerase III subunit beta [Lentisphaeria bacterium]|jgi:DNA polymerase-3 subunit beta